MSLTALLFGYVRIRFSECLRGRLLRALHTARIPIVSFAESGDCFTVTMTRAAYKRYLSLPERFEALSESRGGLPKHIHSILGRPTLLLGAILGLIILFFCRSRIWEIRIVGDGSIDEDRMRLLLEEAGLWEGMLIDTLDEEAATTAYLMRDGSVAWMQIRREGVVAYVDWIAAKAGEDEGQLLPARGVGANLVAAEDAVIHEILVEQGLPSVKLGQVVKKGDLLVSGLNEGGAGYAQGKIIGLARRTVSVFVPYRLSEAVAGEEALCGVRISLFGFSFSVGKTAEADAAYRDHLRIGSLCLPLYIERLVKCEIEEKETRRSESELVRLASKKLAAELGAILAEGELCSKKTVGSFSEEGYTLTAEIEYLINIAKTLEFSIKNE